MAKKRSKAKLDTATAIDAVRRKLASGRSMGALQDAKQLVKVDPSDDALALLGDAYAARIQDFVVAFQDSEARDTLAAARAALPHSAERWDNVEAGFALRSRAAMPSAAIASDVLRRDLTDPRRLSTPEAAIVVTALEEACAGKLSASAREALRDIAADSPLDPWRHFAIAVGAFYDKQDRTALRALSRITSDAACAPLARVLGAMIEGKAVQEPRARALRARVLGDEDKLLDLAQRVIAARSSGDRHAFVRDLDQFLVRLVTKQRRLALRYARYLLANVAALPLQAPALIALLQRVLGFEAKRLVAVRYRRSDAILACSAMLEWLLKSTPPDLGVASESARRKLAQKYLQQTTIRKLSPSELALALAELAALATDARPSFEWSLEGLRILDAEDACAAILARSDYELDADSRVAADAFVGLHVLVHALRRDVLPFELLSASHDFDALVAELHCQIYALRPTDAQFEVALRALDDLGQAELGRRFAESCIERDARAIAPRIVLMERTLARGDHSEAMTQLDAAEAIDPLHSEVRKLRFDVLRAALRQHFREKNSQLMADDLAALAVLPAARDGDRVRYLRTARIVCGLDVADVPLRDTKEIEVLVRDDLVASETELVVQSDRLTELCDALRFAEAMKIAYALRADWTSLDAVSVYDLALPSQDLALLCQHVLDLREEGSKKRIAAFVHFATSLWLRQRDEGLALAFAYRSVALVLAARRRDFEATARAAYSLAKDEAETRLIAKLFDKFGVIDEVAMQDWDFEPTLAAGEVDALLRRERDYLTLESRRSSTAKKSKTAAKSKDARKKRGDGRHAPRQLSLFDPEASPGIDPPSPDQPASSDPS